MKYALLIGCLLASGCQNCRTLAPDSNTAIYVIVGQSLAGGFFDTPMQDAPDNRIQFYKAGQWQLGQEPSSDDPASVYTSGMSFAKEMLRLNPSTPIGIVNCARGSTTLDEWMPGSAANPNLPVSGLFEACTEMVNRAIAANHGSHVTGILYNEGQSLAHECQAGYWASKFPKLVEAFQATYGDITVVFSQLGQLPEECGADYLDSVRSQQAAIKVHNVKMVSTLDLATTDGVHMDSLGHVIEGQRWALAMHQASGGESCSEPWWSRMFRIS